MALASSDFSRTIAPHDQIVWYARQVLAEYVGTEVWAPAAQLKAASLHTAHEYAGRFLIELLQNAHDAHPRDRRDGRITIVVDADEGDFGTVYVANAGTPFAYESMTSLCKLARSPKVVGEGIGHKGVGFRSVLPVCKWPEIYSADPDGQPGNLDGYSFHFARYADLLTLTGGDESLARKVDREFPPFQIPVPADSVPGAVRSLAEMGHVTVIRLPLDGPSGQASALSLLDALAGSDVPVLLFLERIASLTLVRRKGGASREEVLTRGEKPMPSVIIPPDDLHIALVDLGEHGEFVVASTQIAPERLRLAVSSAIDAHLLSDDWTDWEDAVVSVAVPADFDTAGRIFTFLPMGEEAQSPFSGHLNAPFFTKLDRTALDPAHPLNDLLLTVAGETAAAAAKTLQRMPMPAARRWVSDLVCWDGPHRERLADAVERLYKSRLTSLRLVPVEATAGHEDGWACVAETVRWPTGQLKILTAARAAAAGACLLDPTLGAKRSAAWERLGNWLGCPLEPGAEQLAALVEVVLAQLERPAPYHDQDDPTATRRRARRPAGRPAGISRSSLPAAEKIRVEHWAAAYADLAVLFDATENVLNGREILVDDTGTLRSANVQTPPRERRRRAKRVSAFLPPARDEAPVNVPASLRHHLFYLHPAVAEQLTTAVRSFLTGKGLIYGYDTRGLLEHVQGVLAGTESERIHRETLRFVFTLDQNGQIPRRPALNQLGLRVPARGGTMLPAPRTAFGPGWPDRHGTDLATVIDEAGDVDPDLAALGNRLVDPSPDLVRRGETTTQWAAFLARVGVVDGLPAFSPGPANPKVYGRQLGTDQMVRRFRLSPSIAEQWSDHLASSPQIRAAHPDTEYVAPNKPVWILGQAAAERLQPRARLAYARLIMYGLSHWPTSYLETQWERDRTGNKDRQSIPTPLAAFIHEAEWVPAAPHPGGPAFARPGALWHFPVGSDEAEPGFAALAARSVRGELDRQRAVLNALRAAGLSVWGEPEYAASLVRHLGEIAAKGAVTDGQWDQFLRAYLQAWSDVATVAGPPDLTSVDDLWLVLRRGVRLEASRVNDLAANDIRIYVAQPADGLHLRLLAELELPLLLVDGGLDRVRQELASGLGDLVRVVDENAVAVAPAGLAEPGDLLADGLRWLVVLVAAAADHGRGLTMQDRPFDELALRLRNLRVRSYGALGLTLFDHPTALPTSRHGLLAQPDDENPSVLAPAPLSGLSGTELVVLSEEITVAVGRPDLQERVRAAVLELLRSGGDHPNPGDDDIAEALRLSVKQVESTRLRLSGGLDAIVRRLYPVLVYWVGQVAADAAADAARAVKGISELTDALSMAGPLPVDADQLVATARTATSLGELRAALALDFASFNQVIRTLTPEYAPISHQAEHEQALRGYLSLFRATLIDQLRWSRLADFDGRRPQPDWRELRTFSWVTVPAEWGETVEKTSRPLLEELIDNAFASKLGAATPITGPALSPIDTVQPANRSRVARAAPGLVPQ